MYNNSKIIGISYKTEMKILKTKENLRILKIFTINDVLKIFPNFRQQTLYDWEKDGYIKKIRNKYYVFADENFNNLGFFLISNKIYHPSYISLELALNYYGIIPEEVMQITAISTRKSNAFETEFGIFSYRSIKYELFWGYSIIDYEGIGVKIADPEKAMLDYLYLNSKVSFFEDFESLRINKEILNKDRLVKYSKIFNNVRLTKRVDSLIKYLEKSD